MNMKLVKTTKQYSIYKRGDARYAVKDARKHPINGEAKAKILLEENLVTAVLPKKPAVEAAGEQEPAAAVDAEPSAQSQ